MLKQELIALNSQLQATLDQQRTASDGLQNILYSTNVATLFLDQELRIRFFTPATKAIFGIIPSDIGRPLIDLQSLADDDDLLADAGIVLRDGSTIEREISGPDQCWFQRLIFPYRIHDDRIDGVVITFRDVTDRRKTAAALEEARHAAEKANRGKSRFLAVASQDLREPLQALTLIQDMLLQSVEGEKSQELIGRFGLLLDAMGGMLNSLIDINQIETGVIQPSTAHFSAGDIFDRLRALFEPLAEAQTIGLRVMPGTAMLLSDPRLLEVMLRNLLANAVKHTEPGGRILLGCRQKGEMIEIQVWDTGIGIAADQLGSIFDEFHQVDNSAREGERGFGLGLTIVRELGQLLGHEVKVQSQPGKGSVFSVTVARGSRDEVQAVAIAAPASDSRSTGCTIALIEDDAEVRAALEALLTEAGHTVISAKDGPTALALAREGAILPDLVLTDFTLPGDMTGIEVLADLRVQLKRDVPCIVLTGDVSIGALTEIELAECLLLSKPVAAADLHAAIRKLTPQGRRTRVSDTPQPSRLVCVIKGNPEIRETVRSVLEYEQWPVTVYPDAEAFLAAEDSLADQCLIIDTDLPGMSGIALIEHLRAAGDPVPAILITGSGDIAMAVQAIRSGASDFIERPVGRRELVESIERAVSRTPAEPVKGAAGDKVVGRLDALTPRQQTVLERVMAGQPSKNIAADLGVSRRTIEVHRAQIMQRLGVRTIPDLVRVVLFGSAT